MKKTDLYVGFKYYNSVGKVVEIIEIKDNEIAVTSKEWKSDKFRHSLDFVIEALEKKWYKAISKLKTKSLHYEIY